MMLAVLKCVHVTVRWDVRSCLLDITTDIKAVLFVNMRVGENATWLKSAWDVKLVDHKAPQWKGSMPCL